MKKLNNEKFVSQAPAKVLDMENRKKSDAETKIKAIEERLEQLRK
jgi:valyl-tRNA synthetase